MKKEFNNLNDFIEDPSFNRWVIEKPMKEQKIWESWLLENPDKTELVQEAVIILQGIQFNPQYPSDLVIKEQLTMLHQSIAAKEAAYKPIPRPLFSRNRKLFMGMAAGVALLLTLSFLFPLYSTPTTINHQTTFGEIKEIQLPDGSKIALNANSSLHYQSDSPRKIWLDGEAFFEVQKKIQTGENFQVLTNDLTVKVLGTTFNVNSRNNQTKVFLEEGKVVLEVNEKKEEPIVMIPGELVRYSKNSQLSLEKKVSKALDNTAWKNGIIRFSEVSLAVTLQEISDIYGIQFEIKNNALKDQLFSGGIPVNNLAIALETLKEVYEIDIEKNNGIYLIKD